MNSGVGVTQIAQLVGSDKSQVSRSLKVLNEYGIVERDARTRGYRIGWRVLSLAGTSAHANLLAAASPVLDRLVRELDETVHLSFLQGAEVMTILSRSPGRAVEASGWVGRTVPAHCTSSGRALLFAHEPSELEELFRGVDFGCAGPRAPRDVAELTRRIAAARRRGFALVDEELEPGLVAAGAPVWDFAGQIAAAVNVSGPKFRFAKRLNAAGEAVKRAAEGLSAQLGHPGAAREALP